jgi:hypothetical protein
MNHFQWLKKEHGIDLGFSPRDVFTLIESAFTNSVQADVFSHSVVAEEGDNLTVKYTQLDDESLTRIAARREKPESALPEMETTQLIMKMYKPKLDRLRSGIKVHTLETLKSAKASAVLASTLGQEIKKVLDIKAIKLAYDSATKLPELSFDADPPFIETRDEEALRKILGNFTPETQKLLEEFLHPTDSYVHQAQRVSQLVECSGDTMFQTYFRGGVSRIVAGAGSAMYLRLNAGFSRKGEQPQVGVYQIGELYGIPVYKAPEYALEDHQLLCIWKNQENEMDVGIHFTNSIPLYYSVDRKEFDILGDYRVLNPQYISRCKIINLRSS